MTGLVHHFVSFELPAGWSKVEAEQPLFAQFDGPYHEVVNVMLGEVPAPVDVHALVDHAMEVHETSIRDNNEMCDARAPQLTIDNAAYVEARRDFVIRSDGPYWNVFARYAVSNYRLLSRTGREVHAFVQLVYYGSAWAPSSAVIAALTTAPLVPALAALPGTTPMGPALRPR